MFQALTIFLLLLALPTWGEAPKVLLGPDPLVDVISDVYEAGPYLIYDCHQGHWVCVTEELHEDCANRRKQEIDEKIEKLSCGHFGKFPNKISCFQRQLFLVSNAHGSRFCTHSDWRQKEISWD
jgi:hypothetical protein